MYSEALNETKETPDAEVYEYIQKVRNRAGLDLDGDLVNTWANHSDNPNKPLSKDRANEVAKVLRESSIDTRAGGLGSSFPVDSNNTESGKAKNRRAEVWVVKP